MADTKISALTALTGANLAADDNFVVVDTSVTTTKRMTTTELKVGLGGIVQGTFTATLTGVDASVTGTAVYSITNNVVTLYLPILSGTSNADTMTVTGLPAAITPVTDHFGLSGIGTNNGSVLSTPIRADVLTTSVVRLLTTFNGTGWTATGTKGLSGGLTITYNLN